MNYEDRVTKEYVESALAAKCEIVFGSYAGDGASGRSISLGFTPKAVLLFSNWGQTYVLNIGCYGGLFGPGKPLNYSSASVISGGFSVGGENTNVNNMIYYYLAFK